MLAVYVYVNTCATISGINYMLMGECDFFMKYHRETICFHPMVYTLTLNSSLITSIFMTTPQDDFNEWY